MTIDLKKWLIVSVSTLGAGVISSMVIPANRAVMIVASTAGAMTGLAVTDATAKQKRERDTEDPIVLRAITSVETLLQQQHAEVLKLQATQENPKLSATETRTIATTATPDWHHVIELIQNNQDEVTKLSQKLVQVDQSLATYLNGIEKGLNFGEVIALLQQNHTQIDALGKQLSNPQQNHAQIEALGKQIPNPQALQAITKRTAIFYDIENLIKGYTLPIELIRNFSLQAILEQISTGLEAQDYLGPILIQQAYANWSDGRLGNMRYEMNELGIDPVQIFGFSRGHTKNAADIQLVIDAIDLAYLHTSIEIFVIVSGDGGFASLAKQLRKYGKTVIGCAYEASTSNTFKAVCDHFIPLIDPEAEHQNTVEERRLLRSSPNRAIAIHLNQLRKEVQYPFPSSEAARDLALKILNFYLDSKACYDKLSGKSFYLSIIKEALIYVVPELETELNEENIPNSAIFSKFSSFATFMRYVCTGTEIRVVKRGRGKYLMLASAIPEGYTELESVTPQALDSEGHPFVEDQIDALSNVEPSQTSIEAVEDIDVTLKCAANLLIADQLSALKEATTQPPQDLERARDLTWTILEFYLASPECREQLSQTKLFFSHVREALNFVVPAYKTELDEEHMSRSPIFQQLRSFPNFLRYVCSGTELCIVKIPKRGKQLALRGVALESPDAVLLEDIVLPTDADERESLELGIEESPA